jgi:hypothetical protein
VSTARGALVALAVLLAGPFLPAAPAAATTGVVAEASVDPARLRIATINVNLRRRGPGLLLRDIEAGTDAQIRATVALLAALDADVLLLTAVDHDFRLRALSALAARLAEAGQPYPHLFALPPNSGMATGLDMDGDGRLGTPDDAQGYGAFAGASGMAILSRLPVVDAGVRDFSGFLWRDLPGASLPDQPLPEAVLAIQRLPSTGHWEVPLALPDGGTLRLLAFHASPPAFGGPGQRNLRRNHDEVRFWSLLLDGALPMAPPAAPFVIVGDANLDPNDGDGAGAAMAALLAHPALQDPAPRSPGGAEAGVGRGSRGDPGLHTTDWPQARGPGNLRVDYVLPSAGLQVAAAGVFWPARNDPARALLSEGVEGMTRHRAVWVDLDLTAMR